MVAPARGSTAGPGEGRRGAKTAGATPTTGCVTPPGGVGVERSRDILLIVAPSLRFGGAPAERGENPPISPRGTRSWSFRRAVLVTQYFIVEPKSNTLAMALINKLNWNLPCKKFKNSSVKDRTPPTNDGELWPA